MSVADKEALNTKQFNHMDKNLRALVDEYYDFCLYKCNEKAGPGNSNCKSDCFKNVFVPYKFINHAARENEDNLYRKCLAEKFPSISQGDYIDCTKQLYKERANILSEHMATVATTILAEIH